MITKFSVTTNINEALIDTIGLHPFIVTGIYPTCITDYDKPCGNYLPYFRHPTSNLASITQFAENIQLAETQIQQEIGTPLSPTNICNESRELLSHYRTEISTVNITSHIFKTDYSSVIDYGNYESTTVGAGTVTYLDIDGDGFKEIAQVDFDNTAGHPVDDLRLYFQGFYAEFDNEIAPVRYTTTSGNIVSFFLDSWLLIDPSKYTERSFTAFTALDACDENNYVTTVDVGLWAKNTCNPDGYLYYTEGNCAEDCEELSVPFCMIPYKNKEDGYFKIRLGNIDTETECFSPTLNCDIPQSAKISRIEYNYYAGCSACNLNETLTCNLLKKAAIFIAVSRVAILNCCEQCGGFGDQWNNYQKDVNHFERTGEDRFNYPLHLRSNPFGSRLGEIEAWKLIDTVRHDVP